MVNKRGKSQSYIHQSSSEEHDLWIAVTTDVKPLGGRSKEAVCEGHSSNIRSAELKQRKNIKQRANLDPNKTPELRHGLAPGLDTRTRARLRRG